MRKRFLGYSLTALLVVSAFAILAIPVKTQTPTTLELVNPIDGSHLFNFTTSQKSVGDTFVVEVWVKDVTDLFSWQVGVGWDPSLLDLGPADVSIPDDNIFAGKSYLPAGPDFPVPGYVVFGASLGPGQTGVSGSGKLCVFTFHIIKGVSVVNPKVECDFLFENIGVDTFLLDSLGNDIEFTPVNAHYIYQWVIPEKKPRFYLSPPTIKPAKIGDTFTVDVMITDVDPAWEIVAVQFSVMWNTTLINAVEPYWAPGTFFETFQYAPDGVLYAVDINTHSRPPPMTPIPEDYNYSCIGIILMPDPAANDTYHPPFPSTKPPYPSSGKLATLYFKAVYETIAPEEVWSNIEFITYMYPWGQPEDMFVLNQYGMEIGYSRADPARYRAPVKTLGLAIDVYTQYPYPYGGQGPNAVSDMFGPQQQVELYALVTYNEYPVQQKLVGFQIEHNGYHIYREATTDEYGVAHISFRIPWPCVNPEEEIFGEWDVIATVEVAERKANDTLKFWVWWPVEVLSIESKYTTYKQTKNGVDMTFIISYGTYRMQPINATLTITVYDELGFFIGSHAWEVTNLGWGEYDHFGEMKVYGPEEITIHIPSNAVVGLVTVYANAYDKLPWYGGTPYCPEVKNTEEFRIVK
jgi:hypothetical protein